MDHGDRDFSHDDNAGLLSSVTASVGKFVRSFSRPGSVSSSHGSQPHNVARTPEEPREELRMPRPSRMSDDLTRTGDVMTLAPPRFSLEPRTLDIDRSPFLSAPSIFKPAKPVVGNDYEHATPGQKRRRVGTSFELPVDYLGHPKRESLLHKKPRLALRGPAKQVSDADLKDSVLSKEEPRQPMSPECQQLLVEVCNKLISEHISPALQENARSFLQENEGLEDYALSVLCDKARRHPVSFLQDSVVVVDPFAPRARHAQDVEMAEENPFKTSLSPENPYWQDGDMKVSPLLPTDPSPLFGDLVKSSVQDGPTADAQMESPKASWLKSPVLSDRKSAVDAEQSPFDIEKSGSIDVETPVRADEKSASAADIEKSPVRGEKLADAEKSPVRGEKSADAEKSSISDEKPAGNSAECFWVSQIKAIYARRNPKKLTSLDALLEKYKNKEATLFIKICRQYDLDSKKNYTLPSSWGEDKDMIEEDAPVGSQAVDSIFDKSGMEQGSVGETAVGDTPKPSIFGEFSLFGEAKSSIFGEAKSSIFGEEKSSIFGEAKSSIFGEAKSSIFGEAKSSIFGTPGNADSSPKKVSIFGAPETSIPSGSAPEAGTSIFGTKKTAMSIFGSNADSSGAFGVKHSSSIFGERSMGVEASRESIPDAPISIFAGSSLATPSNGQGGAGSISGTSEPASAVLVPIEGAKSSIFGVNAEGALATVAIPAGGESSALPSAGEQPATEAPANARAVSSGAPAKEAEPPILGTPAKKPAAASSFGASAKEPAETSIFGAPATESAAGSIFETPSTEPTAASIFGAATKEPVAASIFGAPATSIFGAPAKGPEAGSIFGAPAEVPATSIFGAPAKGPEAASIFSASAKGPEAGSIFGAPATTSIFGAPAKEAADLPNPGAFAEQPAASIGAAKEPAVSSIFGTPAQGGQSIFGKPSAGNSIFEPPEAEKDQAISESIFGSKKQQESGSARSPAASGDSAPETNGVSQSFAPSIFGELSSRKRVPTEQGRKESRDGIACEYELANFSTPARESTGAQPGAPRKIFRVQRTLPVATNPLVGTSGDTSNPFSNISKTNETETS